MDRPQRRNPSSGPLKPPRPPRGTAFHPPPASRPRLDPSSPDGRPRKQVRFESEAASHREYARQDANTSKADKTKAQGSDAKTTEFKFFKKLWEQSGCRSRSFRQPHQNIAPDIYKQKEGNRIEPHNVTSHKKFPVQKVTLCSDEAPATPSNNEISDEKVKVQASHSEYGNHDTPQLKPCDSLPTVQVFTPMIKTPFELAGISRNTDIEPESGRMFSEKRRRLLKLAAKTVSMESCELFQRRSEFFADVLQRLGASNIIRKLPNALQQHKEPMRKRKMVCRNTPADPKCQFANNLDYRLGNFDSLSRLRSGKEPSSYASDKSRQFLALPWVDDQDLPSFLDWRNDLPCGDNEAHDCMPVPSAHTTDLASFDMKRQTVHNQVSNWLLEDVQPHSRVKPTSSNELGCIIQTGSYDHHGWATSDYPSELGPKSFCDPAVRMSCFAETEEKYSSETELFDNSDIGRVHGLDQLPVKFTASSFSKYTSGILDHHHDPKDSNSIFPADAKDTCLNSLASYSEHPCKQDWESLCDFSQELWSSVHHVQSHGGSLGAIFGLTSNGSICNDFEDGQNTTLAKANPKNRLFGTSDLALFGSCSTMDSIRETPMLSLDGVMW